MTCRKSSFGTYILEVGGLTVCFDSVRVWLFKRSVERCIVLMRCGVVVCSIYEDDDDADVRIAELKLQGLL